MKTIENSITVDVPVSRAYNQWTQFEDFHNFMEGVILLIVSCANSNWHIVIGLSHLYPVPLSEP